MFKQVNCVVSGKVEKSALKTLLGCQHGRCRQRVQLIYTRNHHTCALMDRAEVYLCTSMNVSTYAAGRSGFKICFLTWQNVHDPFDM